MLDTGRDRCQASSLEFGLTRPKEEHRDFRTGQNISRACDSYGPSPALSGRAASLMREQKPADQRTWDLDAEPTKWLGSAESYVGRGRDSVRRCESFRWDRSQTRRERWGRGPTDKRNCRPAPKTGSRVLSIPRAELTHACHHRSKGKGVDADCVGQLACAGLVHVRARIRRAQKSLRGT
jgi:hypothetical protein